MMESKIAGYFLALPADRYNAFIHNWSDRFGEPVPEFKHSRNIPLICFIITPKGFLTYVGLGKRGVSAGTERRRLNVTEAVPLNNPFSIVELVNFTPARIRHNLIRKIGKGGLISPKSFEEFLIVLLKSAPELKPFLDKYSRSRRLRIAKLTSRAKESLAEQKEAVLTAMNIAGIDKSMAHGFDYSEKTGPTSFLDGIEKVRLREDSLIINDLNHIPGFEVIRPYKYTSAIFESDRSRLEIILANRLPLEELLGTDLIYYNEDFKCFIMVQYKMMEKEGHQFLFRVPNGQLTEEIIRMDSVISYLNAIARSSHIDDFRINSNPFFLKICPRIEFDPDNVGLSSGMYIPLEYFKLLQTDDSIKGEKGGMAISYENVGRYFDNTGFKTIIEGGWIGTYIPQSIILKDIIRITLEQGKTAVLAIKRRIHRENPIRVDKF